MEVRKVQRLWGLGKGQRLGCLTAGDEAEAIAAGLIFGR
jgi:hypothetical protein